MRAGEIRYDKGRGGFVYVDNEDKEFVVGGDDGGDADDLDSDSDGEDDNGSEDDHDKLNPNTDETNQP